MSQQETIVSRKRRFLDRKPSQDIKARKRQLEKERSKQREALFRQMLKEEGKDYKIVNKLNLLALDSAEKQ